MVCLNCGREVKLMTPPENNICSEDCKSAWASLSNKERKKRLSRGPAPHRSVSKSPSPQRSVRHF